MRPWLDVDSDAILEGLSTRQYLRPHDSVALAVTEVCDRLGVCPNAAGHALAWLGVDRDAPVGRLRRTELVQLARSIHRIWRQAADAPATAPMRPEPA
jgi:hypothetical protein